MQLVVFLVAQESQTADTLFPLPNQPGRIYIHRPISHPLSIAQAHECLVSVGRCGRFAVGAEPPLEFLRGQIGGRLRPQIFSHNGSLADVVTAVLW